jgi:hypothetical protein
VGHVVRSGASRKRNVDAPFFVLGCAWYRFHKKHAWVRYTDVVFLHPVGSTDDVVCPAASEPRNVYAQFFKLGWAWYGF